ncbi:MAG: hypothetical protein M3457_16490, partial [Chloroflexota bacterium]|nr:hypothetical protein [Chloroflexota bacterium]
PLVTRRDKRARLGGVVRDQRTTAAIRIVDHRRVRAIGFGQRGTHDSVEPNPIIVDGVIGAAVLSLEVQERNKAISRR